MMLEIQERYYSMREAAQRLGLSKGRIHQFITEGRLRSERIGNILVIPESELERFAAQERKPGRPKSKY